MTIIQGNIHTDYRGTIRFVNDFNLTGIKRFYTITHPDIETIRAWQGHKLETKYFYVTKGSFVVNWIKPDNWERPSKNIVIKAHILTDSNSEILVIPPGHINGFKALEPGSILIVFSDFTLGQSLQDDYRFPSDYFDFSIDPLTTNH